MEGRESKYTEQRPQMNCRNICNCKGSSCFNPFNDLTHLGLCGRPVFIRPTHIDDVIAPGAAEACVAVGAEHTSDDVAQVGDIVDVWKGAGDLWGQMHIGGRKDIREEDISCLIQ